MNQRLVDLTSGPKLDVLIKSPRPHRIIGVGLSEGFY